MNFSTIRWKLSSRKEFKVSPIEVKLQKRRWLSRTYTVREILNVKNLGVAFIGPQSTKRPQFFGNVLRWPPEVPRKLFKWIEDNFFRPFYFINLKKNRLSCYVRIFSNKTFFCTSTLFHGSLLEINYFFTVWQGLLGTKIVCFKMSLLHPCTIFNFNRWDKFGI